MVEKVNLRQSRVVTMRELNQQTSTVIDEINESGQPALLTKHGRFVAMITPLESRIESIVFAADEDLKGLVDAAERREVDGSSRGLPLTAAEAWMAADD
jgi:antitoxin (DNA-binding transcriptional repressor) of toxin-antitoxin stability system